MNRTPFIADLRSTPRLLAVEERAARPGLPARTQRAMIADTSWPWPVRLDRPRNDYGQSGRHIHRGAVRGSLNTVSGVKRWD